MTVASQWRLALARMLAARYAALPAVTAVFVGGSTSRQQADRFSDIEMTILWSSAPSEPVRAEVIASLNGDLHRQYPYDQHEQLWEDVFFLGRNQANQLKSGCQVEISHYLQPTMEEAVNRVLNNWETDQELHNLMAGICDCIPLLNAPLIHSWQDRLRGYPVGLQVSVLQRYGIIDHFWRWKMLVDRGNNRMELAALFTTVLHQILHLLFGLNKIYFGGFKWLDAQVAQLELAPPHLVERIRRVYELAPDAAAAAVIDIVEQTFGLIEQHVPAVDTARFRQVFYYQRPQWEDPPPLALPPFPGL